jgi:hypothetical protein
MNCVKKVNAVSVPLCIIACFISLHPVQAQQIATSAHFGASAPRDSKGSWRDNVFVERIWKSIKYEDVYFDACETIQQAWTLIGRIGGSTIPADLIPT